MPFSFYDILDESSEEEQFNSNVLLEDELDIDTSLDDVPKPGEDQGGDAGDNSQQPSDGDQQQDGDDQQQDDGSGYEGQEGGDDELLGEIEEFFRVIDVESKIWSWVYQVAQFGDKYIENIFNKKGYLIDIRDVKHPEFIYDIVEHY